MELALFKEDAVLRDLAIRDLSKIPPPAPIGFWVIIDPAQETPQSGVSLDAFTNPGFDDLHKLPMT